MQRKQCALLLTLLLARGAVEASTLGLRGSERARLRTEALALSETEDEKAVLAFLVDSMPPPDIGVVSAEYLASNARLALQAWQRAPWKKSVPWEVFLNNVAPYAVISEERDDWRPMLTHLLMGEVSETTVAEAAMEVNRKLWRMWDPPIHFVADQAPATLSPFEVIDARNASCSGLSILLVDALRAVGLPARMAGIPAWNTPTGGNHNWVEVWVDGEWHFMGATEPSAAGLDHAWFFPYPANTSVPGANMHSVYATSWAPTPSRLYFPLYWDLDLRWVWAEERTEWYTSRAARNLSGDAEHLTLRSAGTAARK